MSYTYLRAQGEASSAASFADIKPFAPSRSNRTAAKSCCNANATAFCHGSLFGTMCAPSTARHGAAKSTSSAAASHAKTSPSPERVRASLASAAACGGSSRASLAKYDHVSCLWRTRQHSLFAGLAEFSATWPRWGLMQSGECWERTMPAHRTSATGFGFWPTAQVSDATGGWAQPPEKRMAGGHQVRLTDAVRFPTPLVGGAGPTTHSQISGRFRDALQKAFLKFPTPSANKQTASGELVNADGIPWDGSSKPHSAKTGKPVQTALMDAVRKFPTPTAQDAKNNGAPSQIERNTKPLNAEVGGPLNPPWIEWLMGWPIGWTDLRPLATDKFQQWLHSHGGL